MVLFRHGGSRKVSHYLVLYQHCTALFGECNGFGVFGGAQLLLLGTGSMRAPCSDSRNPTEHGDTGLKDTLANYQSDCTILVTRSVSASRWATVGA